MGGVMIIIKNRMKLSRLLLNKHVKKIVPATKWDELTLAEPEKAVLRQAITGVRSSKGGLVVLFRGENGSGKTMAAEVIARELELNLYKIDLAGMTSKYIGETEKNLKQIFNAAESSHPVLFFDEADALFDKRTGVKDSHHSHANIAVSYLLQRMKAYSGPIILSIHSETKLDPEFQKLMCTKLRVD